MRLGLENIARVLERLGNPERMVPAVLVAGTNGKGSVTTYCAAVFRAAGLRVGAYYSPHLFRIHERIRCGGAEVSSRELDEAVGRVREAAGPAALTYFECLTAAAILIFRERAVDIAVFEVGLGGRLDATNLVDAAATVVTGISRDHREHLGATKRRILAEKLGILRPGIPLVANLGPAALERQAREAAAAAGAPWHSVRGETRGEIARIDPDGMAVRLETPRRDYGTLFTRMIGAAQAGNVATAARTVEVLDESLAARRVSLRTAARRRPRRGLDRLAMRCAGIASGRAVRSGVAEAFLPGRFQTISRDPHVIVDVSHNEESFVAAIDTLRTLDPPGRSVLVFGMLAHKELGSFPSRAAAAVDTIVVTPLADRRSAPAENLAAAFRGASGRRRRAEIVPARGMAEAMRAARLAAGERGVVLVMGSHVAVEEAAPYI
jgi:dihydrofolate synthase/folylpolyglutamate synthase